MKNSAHNRGFTLVEILLVVSIIAVLSAFLIPGFSNYTKSQSIKQGIEILKSDLRTAQNNALTGVNSVSANANYWGVKIAEDNAKNYYTFSAVDNSASTCNNLVLSTARRSQTLPGNVEIQGANGVCVFFSKANGDATIVNNGGSNQIYLGNEGETACEGVLINPAGMMRPFDECT